MPDEDVKMTEQEAIAEVMRLGQEMNEKTTIQTTWYAQRIGTALIGLGIAFLLMLFAYTVMSKSTGIPVLGLVSSFAVLAAGAGVLFWSLNNSPSKGDE